MEVDLQKICPDTGQLYHVSVETGNQTTTNWWMMDKILSVCCSSSTSTHIFSLWVLGFSLSNHEIHLCNFLEQVRGICLNVNVRGIWYAVQHVIHTSWAVHLCNARLFIPQDRVISECNRVIFICPLEITSRTAYVVLIAWVSAMPLQSLKWLQEFLAIWTSVRTADDLVTLWNWREKLLPERKDSSPLHGVMGGLSLKKEFFAFLHCSIICIHWFGMWASGTWPRRNIVRILKLQIRSNAGLCLLPWLGYLQEAEPRISFPCLVFAHCPFALAWMLSHAVTDLSEEEGDKSHDITVLTLCKPGFYDSLDFCPGIRRKQDHINMVCVCSSSPSVTHSPLLTSELVVHLQPSWAKEWSSQRY